MNNSEAKKEFSIWGLLISIGIAELVGASSALLSGNIRSGYTEMTQPPLSPPAIVFPIAWIILYALMGAAAYLVYIKPDNETRSRGLTLYALQLAVNFSWSIVFFRLTALSAAYAIIRSALRPVCPVRRKFRQRIKDCGVADAAVYSVALLRTLP